MFITLILIIAAIAFFIAWAIDGRLRVGLSVAGIVGLLGLLVNYVATLVL